MKSIVLKSIFLFINLLLLFLKSQVVSITTSYDGEYRLKSTSYEGNSYGFRGKSTGVKRVYNEQKQQSEDSILYTINRSFNVSEAIGHFQFVALSKDGRKIIYLNRFPINNDKSIVYYVDGKLIKEYDVEEFINCNRNQEKCDLFYDNRLLIYDGKRSNYSLTVYKRGTDEKERYLRKNFIYNKNDTIHVIDARKKITLFDLGSNEIIKTKLDFDSLYPQIKDYERKESYVRSFQGAYKSINDFQNQTNDEKLSATISKFSNLKYIPLNERNSYSLHKIELSGYLDHNGKFEIEKFDCDNIFIKKQIGEYIKNTVFKADFIPKESEKYYFEYFWGGYRDFDDKIAEQETIKEQQRKKQEFNKRLKLDKIDGIYIPKNLHDCMIELDKILNFEIKKDLKNAKDTFDFNGHMGGLGMWIRNKWGINGGSRLLKYFNDRGDIGNREYGREIISGIIISTYMKWLTGDKNSWKDWERQNPVK
ncbi:hypothetical protein OF897_00845 [Chryseobacterium formosus]|uniref:DUF6794 domain-containing protein n=1 Tax=Chryseobacterium formosus TaxID=1537363 RepID=A0ABT3XK03_9FLAO|nr:DUF6794 domain-containing protein [Chryseobacterium formosus]MCX8522470.1 hypothetical protein [Chryseobacterium formosus]